MAEISARASARASSSNDAPAERIAAIAGRVRRPTALVSAQAAFRDMQEHHATRRDELRGLIAELQANGGEANATGPQLRRIRELDVELSSLSEALREGLARLFETREPFAAAVAAALAPERKASAERALAAATTLIAEFEVQDLIDREISSAGGQPGPHPLPQFRGALAPTITRLRRLALE